MKKSIMSLGMIIALVSPILFSGHSPHGYQSKADASPQEIKEHGDEMNRAIIVQGLCVGFPTYFLGLPGYIAGTALGGIVNVVCTEKSEKKSSYRGQVAAIGGTSIGVGIIWAILKTLSK